MQFNRKLLLYTSAAVLLSLGAVGCGGKSKTAQTTAPTTAGAPRTDEANEAAERLNAAATTLNEIMATPDAAIPQDLLDHAECVVIVPGLKKGAFIVGGQYGKGYFSCRAAGGQGWTAPGTVRMEGGSFGLQIGGQETDVVLLVMNERGRERLLSSQFKIGVDASAVAGPVGRTAAAGTDPYLRAEMLSYSRARGAFAGVSLDGTTVRQDLDDNEALYGRRITNTEIIQGGVPAPAAARSFIDALNKYSPRKKS